MIGNCGLCRQRAELRDSHFLPRALYRLARDPDSSANPNPVVVTQRRAVNTSRQVHDPFLCAACEQRFSAGGESYVLAQVVRPSGEFILRDRVRAAPEVARSDRWAVHDISAADIQVERYMYFAASVLWRAAARAWVFEGQCIPQMALEAEYHDRFREYLLSQGPFPEHVRLFVHVWTDDRIHFTSVAPVASQPEGTWRLKFCVPGITFTCFVGGQASTRHDAGALNGSTGSHMWLTPFEADPLFRGFAELAQGHERGGDAAQQTDAADKASRSQ